MIFFWWFCGALNVHVTDEHGGIFFPFHHDVRLPDTIYQGIFMLCPNEAFSIGYFCGGGGGMQQGDFWVGHKKWVVLRLSMSVYMLDREIFLIFFVTPPKKYLFNMVFLPPLEANPHIFFLILQKFFVSWCRSEYINGIITPTSRVITPLTCLQGHLKVLYTWSYFQFS